MPLSFEERVRSAVWVIVIAVGIVLLFVAIDWGIGAALGTYDVSQDHRTYGGGKGNPRSERARPQRLNPRDGTS